jgi:hypothetical protein
MQLFRGEIYEKDVKVHGYRSTVHRWSFIVAQVKPQGKRGQDDYVKD